MSCVDVSRPFAHPVDDRGAARHLTVLIVGKVSGPRGDYACVVDDISPTGLKARFPHPPLLGERLTFGLRGLPALGATVRWADGLRGGAEFDRPVDLALLCDQRVARPPRFPCTRPASLILGGRGYAVTLIDVSPGGAKLNAPSVSAEASGQAATLLTPGLAAPCAGRVCWVTDRRVGFLFDAPLRPEELKAVLTQVA